MRDIPSLTGLRGIAAIWVMLFHVSLLAPLIGAAWLGRIGVFPVGWVGVDLFFVLSGFILMWVHGAEDQAGAAAGSQPGPRARRRLKQRADCNRPSARHNHAQG
jgi:peptidoglycan/LPS O-acetylase OafA/YrhL